MKVRTLLEAIRFLWLQVAHAELFWWSHTGVIWLHKSHIHHFARSFTLLFCYCAPRWECAASFWHRVVSCIALYCVDSDSHICCNLVGGRHWETPIVFEVLASLLTTSSPPAPSSAYGAFSPLPLAPLLPSPLLHHTACQRTLIPLVAAILASVCARSASSTGWWEDDRCRAGGDSTEGTCFGKAEGNRWVIKWCSDR